MTSLSFILTICVIAFVAIIICAILFSAGQADAAMDAMPQFRVVCPCGTVQVGPHGRWVRPIHFRSRENDSHGICPKCKELYLSQLAKLAKK